MSFLYRFVGGLSYSLLFDQIFRWIQGTMLQEDSFLYPVRVTQMLVHLHDWFLLYCFYTTDLKCANEENIRINTCYFSFWENGFGPRLFFSALSSVSMTFIILLLSLILFDLLYINKWSSLDLLDSLPISVNNKAAISAHTLCNLTAYTGTLM